MSDEKIRTETAKSFMKAIEFLVKRNFNDKYFFKVFIKLLIYHLGKVSKNVLLKNKEIIINRAVLLINKIKNYSASIKFYEKFFINIILFLLKTLKFKSLIIFQALKNVV